ncbi:hypothetical protein CVT25_006778 [Psilocybe cyanescens]|uniref:Uncharacterized protein n=1 Tax=Psilocybe cyanescens TaxID=93625 RepID=A0A409X7D4_PSICY|nr:hypothetical protein CVT25_006778 [Psilocybe cyanescens]
MGLSLLFSVVICVLASSAFAAPVPGKDQPVHPPVAVKSQAPPAVAAANTPPTANPGDFVIVKSKDFLGTPDKINPVPNKPHPAVVLAHDDAHVLSIVRVGHSIPGTKHIEPASKFNLPDDDRPNHSIDAGNPKQIHLKDVNGLRSDGGLPQQTSPEHLKSLQSHIDVFFSHVTQLSCVVFIDKHSIAANAAADTAPVIGRKQKVEGSVEQN